MSKSFDGVDATIIKIKNNSETQTAICNQDSTPYGIYFKADGTLGFINSNSEMMSIGSSGLNISAPVTSSSDFEMRNLRLSISGCSDPVGASYISSQTSMSNKGSSYSTYFAAPRISGSFIPDFSHNIYIEDAPNSGVYTYALYVNSGTTYFGGQLILNSSRNQLQFGNTKSISLTCSPQNNLIYTIPDIGANANFIMSTSNGGQILNAASVSGLTIKGGIVSFGTDTTTITNYGTSNTIYLNYFAAPAIGNSAPSVAANVYIAGSPSGAATSYSLLINSGTAQFGGSAIFKNGANSIGFVGDSGTGISYQGLGSYSLNSSSTPVAGISATSLNMYQAVNFSSQFMMQLAGSPHFALSSDGLATVANGYPGSISSTVSVKGTVAGTGFNTSTVSINVYYFPLGGKCYYVVISSGTGTSLKTGGSPSSSNFLTVTFSNFTTVNSAFLSGTAGTYSDTTSSTAKNITLSGYTYGSGVSANSIIMVFTTNSTLISGNLWTGTTKSLTVFISGIIFADK